MQATIEYHKFGPVDPVSTEIIDSIQGFRISCENGVAKRIYIKSEDHS